MIQTSQAYRDAVAQSTRSSSARIRFGVYDVSAKDDAAPSADSTQPFTSVQAINGDIREPDYKLASWEPDYFKLDGSFCLMPDDIDPEQDILGWWSQAMSDGNRQFEVAPTITVQFSQLHSSLGIGLFFGTDDYCTDLDVTWYSGGAYVASEPVTATGREVIVNRSITNYDKIVVRFLRTRKPYRYARLMEMSFGVEETFDNNELVSASVIEELDPSGGVLSINELSFTVLNSDQRFNMLNPEGVYAYLQRRQKITAYSDLMLANGDYEQVPLGVYYLSEWRNATGLTATLKATDAIGLLDRTTYYSSPFWVDEPIGNVMRHVLDDAGQFYVSVSPEVAAEKINGYIPVCSHREAIAQILVAARCTLRVGRSGILEVQRVSYEAVAKEVDYGVMIGFPTIEQKQLITAVEAKEYTYAIGPTEEDIHNSTMRIIDTQIVTIPYDNPASAVAITVGGQGSLIGTPRYSATTVIATIFGSGDVTITVRGKPYIESSSLVRSSIASLPAGEVEQTASISDNKLIVGNGRAVTDHMLSYLGRRIRQTFNYWSDPSLQAGDCIDVETMFGQSSKGVIERQEISFSPGLKGRIEVTG